jgi:threonine/homoserine/homoserine lactone efflux protein
MGHAYPLLLAGLTGFVSGLLLSIPVGPINLTILNECARRGFKWGVMIGLGATAMETTYCFIAFTGLAAFFMQGWVNTGMQLISFFFLLYLGIKFLRAKSITTTPPIRFGAASDKIEAQLEQRFHPHSAFMTGFVRVMGNLGVLIFWIILAANLITRGLVAPSWGGKCACVAGVALGTGLWFTSLSWVSAMGQNRFSNKTLLRIEQASGVVLLGVASVHGATLVWHLSGR